jgi:PAS domain S-box-containing protein
MSTTNESIASAAVDRDNFFFISTNENFSITDISSFLLSFTGKDFRNLKAAPVQDLFRQDSILVGDNLSRELKATNYPFYVKAIIAQVSGKEVNTFWVVTPELDKATGEIKSFKWGGCEMNIDKLYNRSLLDGENIYHASQTERYQADLRKQVLVSETVNGIINCITDGFVAFDKNYDVTLWNPVAEKLTGVRRSAILGKNVWKQFPALVRSPAYLALIEALDKNTSVTFQHHLKSAGCWYDVSAYPFQDGLFVYFKDITGRKKQERFLAFEKGVLELTVKSNATLRSTVDFLLQEIESIIPKISCTVVLLDEYNKRMRHLSAPSLPQEFTGLLDGKPVGPNMGTCGTAMFLRRMVVVSDIAKDNIAAFYRDIALKHDLKSCLSLPILSKQGEVMGSFACYYKELTTPSEEEIDTAIHTVKLLQVIIESKLAEEKVRISNDRYVLGSQASQGAIWDWDIRNDIIYWSEGFYLLFGYSSNYKVDAHKFWETRIHPEDRDHVRNSLNDFLTQNSQDLWKCEYRFKKADRTYALVVNRGYLVLKGGGTQRMIGSMEDITEKKRLEKQLLKKEIYKQKMVAQAVLEVQEKERANISRELHDNVNQVLSSVRMFLDIAQKNSKDRTRLITQSSEQIQYAMKEISNLSRTLMPPAINDLGLAESIKDLLESASNPKKIKAVFSYQGDIDNDINYSQKLLLFRIIHEQLNNVLKHSKANILDVQLTVDPIFIELIITDDGCGFDPDKLTYVNGAGLTNIRSRADLFNGKVSIVSAPGKGCKLIVKILRFQ